MKKNAFEKIYKKVPQEQKELLLQFRSTHPPKSLNIDGVDWEYIACGKAKETLVLLPGATGNGEMAFKHILVLENEYQLISPTYPPTAATMAQLSDGIAGILEAEDIPHAHVMGGSFGGILAQCFVRKYPSKVDKLILSHTMAPRPDRVKRIKRVNNLLFLFPLWLIRALFKLEIKKLMPPDHVEREFWLAYLREDVSRLAKMDIKNIFKRGIDLYENYKFTPDDLKDWPGNILIIQSSNDPLAKQESQYSLSNIYPKAQIRTFQGTGHATSILKPEEYRSVIIKFLKSH